MVQTCKIWAKEKKMWGKIISNRVKLKQAKNTFYCIVRKAKKEYWQNFLEDIEESSNLAQIRLKDKNRCWIALKYTKPKFNSTISAFIRPNNEIIVTMQDKEALVKLYTFSPPPIFKRTKYKLGKRTARAFVTKYHIGQVLLFQSIKKALGPNMQNFDVLCILWD